ncbi:MAG: tetratricopeptide repeat protein, partial [Bacteroidales bacterium]|nr:tetratricopeptide repeat protein [Bacteroidales bacterium]
MLRLLFIFPIILLSFYTSFSQISLIDSLKNELSHSSGIQKSAILIDLSNALVYSQTHDALSFSEEAFRIAVDHQSDSLKYAALKAMGYANGYLGNFETSLQNMKDGLVYYEKIADSVRIAEALSDIAWLLQQLSSDEADIMGYNLRALAIREKIGDEKGVAYSLNNIGVLYWDWNKHDEAVGYFLKAAPYFEKLGLDEEVATVLSNIGSYYTEIGQYYKADSFQNRSMELHRKIGHKNGEAQNLVNLARIYLLQDDYSRALHYNETSLKIREAIG